MRLPSAEHVSSVEVYTHPLGGTDTETRIIPYLALVHLYLPLELGASVRCTILKKINGSLPAVRVSQQGQSPLRFWLPWKMEAWNDPCVQAWERHGANKHWVMALGTSTLSTYGEYGPRSLFDFGAVASQRVDFQDGRDPRCLQRGCG